ncbi:hypothetical protein [Shinella zoogloeoides]|uniref:hypothetical protein n=1 Tax=Shinella zoogloeoides TaxID=352475 RepID=UPI001478842B|nr:hypothetical protein [Shinella zoogloeoides]UEX83779.1 hypothetical protein K8M09_11765 [Shinella zoogloeoides]
MVSRMVDRFRELQQKLADVIEHYETPEFKALDGNMAAAFQAICRHVPRNADEERTMAAFFLDLIESNDAGDNIHIIRRVRAIVVDGIARDPPAMEIANGAGI